MKEVLIIRSTITSYVQKKTLLRGCIIACFGVAVLLIAGSYLALELFIQWGWLLFLISIGLITLGMLPYRRLIRQQLKPDELILLNAYEISFSHRGGQLLTIPLDSIDRMEYVPQQDFYGIAIWLKKTPIAPIRIHQGFKIVNKLRKLGKKNGNADLFLPYFNQRGYEELVNWRHQEED